METIELCERCSITQTDQATAEKEKEPLWTLGEYRKVNGGIIFGVHAKWVGG
jgi:uncharacterized protein YcbX